MEFQENAKIRIRRARPDEAHALYGIEVICFPEQEAADEATIRARIEAFGDGFLVAQAQDGRLVGMINGMATDEPFIRDEMFADARLHHAQGRVQTVFGLDVLPQYRGQGVALVLMRAFEQAAREAGRVKVTLTCKERLIGMYEHMGFAKAGVSASRHGGAVWYDMDKML